MDALKITFSVVTNSEKALAAVSPDQWFALYEKGDDCDVLAFREDNQIEFAAIDGDTWREMREAVEALKSKQVVLCVWEYEEV